MRVASAARPRTCATDPRRWTLCPLRSQSQDGGLPRGFARFPPRAKPPSSFWSPDPGGLGLVECLEDLSGVALGLDLGPDLRDAPVRVDEEGPARDAPVGLPVVLLLDPGAVLLGDRVILISEQ